MDRKEESLIKNKLQNTSRNLAFVFQFVIGLGLSGCSREPARFAEGSESVGLTEKVRGYLVLEQGWGSAEPASPRIVAVSLPELKQSVVREGLALAVSGPNKQGRIAFIAPVWNENSAQDGYQLKTIRLDGTGEESVFEKPGRGYHPCVAISPMGDRIAFVGEDMHTQVPGAYLPMGRLEIWDTVKKTCRDTHIIALSQPVYWSPDGKELAFVILASKKEIPNNQSLRTDDEYGAWDRVPVVHVLNIESGEERFLCIGRHALFSSDWKTAVVSSGANYFQVNIDTGQWTKLAKGIGGTPLVLLSKDLIIFRGLPTAGTAPDGSSVEALRWELKWMPSKSKT